MCGRFVALSDPDGLVRFFTIDERQAADLPPSANVAPTEPVYAVARHDGSRVLTTFRWGLVPFWAKDLKVGGRHINARAETVHTAPAFRDSFDRKRCIIPADAFFEWERRPGQKPQPHLFERGDRGPLAFAGLWASWRDRSVTDAERLLTCTIITTDANAVVAPLHDRMPVVLEMADVDAWLDPATPPDALRGLLRPAPDDLLVSRRVSTAVNDVRNKGVELLAPTG